MGGLISLLRNTRRPDAAQDYLQTLAACLKVHNGVKEGCRGYVQLDHYNDGNQQELSAQVGAHDRHQQVCSAWDAAQHCI
jgi:hypothetical protein